DPFPRSADSITPRAVPGSRPGAAGGASLGRVGQWRRPDRSTARSWGDSVTGTGVVADPLTLRRRTDQLTGQLTGPDRELRQLFARLASPAVYVIWRGYGADLRGQEGAEPPRPAV